VRNLALQSLAGFGLRESLSPWFLADEHVRAVAIRSPKKPAVNTTSFCPGSTKFETAASMPALPVPDNA
jgi:hypothetical protein